jgi:hypothetical protein
MRWLYVAACGLVLWVILAAILTPLSCWLIHRGKGRD